MIAHPFTGLWVGCVVVVQGSVEPGNLRIGWISKVKIPAVTPSKIVRVWSGSVRKIANPDGPPGRGRGRDDRGDIGVDDGHVASAWA